MFDARKARKFAKKVCENRLNLWEKLQLEIRDAAANGSYVLRINEDSPYMLLRTTLEVFGYSVDYNNKLNKWEISWYE